MPGFPDDDLERARRASIATVYSRTLGTLAVSFLNAALIVLVLEDAQLSRGPFFWLGLIAIVTVLRAYAYVRYRADGERDDHARFWGYMSMAGALFAGLLWGGGPFLQLSHESAHQWLWAFAIGGMCAGAASLHAAHLPTALSFIFPAALPLSLSLILQGSLPGTVAATMTIAFIGMTTFTAILFSRDFRRMQVLQSAVELRATELADTNRRLLKEMADHRSTFEALHQSQKMEALGNLSGGFAHDFNNILTVIISNLERIADGLPMEKCQELAAFTITAAESGADLISRLLAFARKQTLTPILCNVVTVVFEFQKLLQHAVSGNIMVEFDLAVSTAMAEFDVAQFQAALLNLVVNARDAMPDGGTISISVTKLSLDRQSVAAADLPPGEFISIAVADTGVGMPPEILERVFEPFFTTKGDKGGSGLGLAQVYGFARQSGGLVRMESRVGMGSCITILIPVSHAVPGVLDEGGCSALPSASKRTLSVLLVDDNIAVLRSLEASLKEEAWSVHCVSCANTAMEAMGAEPFDIVVTDVDMPGSMNGRALAQEIHKLYAVPVLLMSGAPESLETVNPTLPMIAKPFRKAALIHRILDVVGEAGRGIR